MIRLASHKARCPHGLLDGPLARRTRSTPLMETREYDVRRHIRSVTGVQRTTPELPASRAGDSWPELEGLALTLTR